MFWENPLRTLAFGGFLGSHTFVHTYIHMGGIVFAANAGHWQWQNIELELFNDGRQYMFCDVMFRYTI